MSLNIVQTDVPVLLGLDLLYRRSLVVDTVTNHLWHRVKYSGHGEGMFYVDKWTIPLSRHDNYIYAPMSFPQSIYYTSSQLTRLHNNLMHPLPQRLYILLKPASERELKITILKIIEEIAKIANRDNTSNVPLLVSEYRLVQNTSDSMKEL